MFVNIPTLGRNGRFGNQMNQYAFARLYAMEHRATLHTPPWIGQLLYGFNETPAPPRVRKVHELVEGVHFPHGQHPPLEAPLIKDTELWGWFGSPKDWTDAETYRTVFVPVPDVAHAIDRGYDQIMRGAETLVAIHLRRGDYGYRQFFVAPCKWYLDWLEQLWPLLNKPVLYIASDEPRKVVPHFARYAPKTEADTGVRIKAAPFFVDFAMLYRADKLAISNSSFSFNAALLNEKATIFLRPHLHERRLVYFNPWSSPVLLHTDMAVLGKERVG